MMLLGSSPRMRGAHIATCSIPEILGIIPAYAGSTRRAHSRPCPAGDHPRVCGEHSSQRYHYYQSEGSSPRMRGAQAPSPRLGVPDGIIPAYAGSTAVTGEAFTSHGDHPRVCGEHVDLDTSNVAALGSSPRMRGALAISAPYLSLVGIIPAYAGSTCPDVHPRLQMGDHPRVCGEHNEIHHQVYSGLGSSPRMRGAPSESSGSGSGGGIIPAYAGSTGRQAQRLRRREDHPRVCGEHSSSRSL